MPRRQAGQQGQYRDERQGDERCDRAVERVEKPVGAMARHAHGVPGADRVQSEQRHRRGALQLHRALQVVADRVERAVRGDGERYARPSDQHGQAHQRALHGLTPAAAAEEPRQHDRDRHEREALDERPDAEQRQPGARPVRADEPQRREHEDHRHEIEMGTQQGTARERRQRRGEQGAARDRPPVSAARAPHSSTTAPASTSVHAAKASRNVSSPVPASPGSAMAGAASGGYSKKTSL